MTYSFPIAVAIRFNDRINDRDLEGLVDLMTEDHTFIDSSNEVVGGREEMRKAWTDFFQHFPDYRNIFTWVESRDNLVVMVGHSVCSHKPLDGPAIWTAMVRDGLVAEWRVYEDKEENRRRLGIASTGRSRP